MYGRQELSPRLAAPAAERREPPRDASPGDVGLPKGQVIKRSTADVEGIDRARSPGRVHSRMGLVMGMMLPGLQPNARCPSGHAIHVARPSAYRQPREVQTMQAAVQGAEGVRVLVLLAAFAVAGFWRAVLRLVV